MGDVRIRECFVQERPLVQQGTQTVQGAAMEHVDGTEHADKAFLHALVGVPREHLDQLVKPMKCRSNVRTRRIGLFGHGDSPLPWAHQPQPTASSGCSPRAIPATSAAVSE